jgi:hypothetical protein
MAGHRAKSARDRRSVSVSRQCHEAVDDLHEVATVNVQRVERRRVGALEAGPHAAVNPACTAPCTPQAWTATIASYPGSRRSAAVCRCWVGAGFHSPMSSTLITRPTSLSSAAARSSRAVLSADW